LGVTVGSAPYLPPIKARAHSDLVTRRKIRGSKAGWALALFEWPFNSDAAMTWAVQRVDSPHETGAVQK
jgi:hypothetical protein